MTRSMLRATTMMGDNDGKPLNNNNNNNYAKEGDLAEGNGKDEPLAEGEEDNKYAEGNNKDEY
jgi:hypothetical protein